MKKILLSIALLPLLTVAVNYPKLPTDFKPNCYEYYYKIDLKKGSYKVNINKNSVIATQNWYILPLKSYKQNRQNFSYTTNIWNNVTFLTDDNYKTYLQLDTWKYKEIIIKLNQPIKNNTFRFIFDFYSKYFTPILFISSDGENYTQVTQQNITNFDFKYLKIWFQPTYKNEIREKIKIYELNFVDNKSFMLLKVPADGKVEFFSNYKCKQYLYMPTVYDNIPIDSQTATITVNLEENPKFNANLETDKDNDWIIDTEDNCPNIVNPQQKDSDWDGKWDVCSDMDKDWVIWYKDNCPDIYNPDQKDINNNWVWDACEFDKDKDWIFDSIDNCITTPNPDQKDLDNDWIWDACDNCKYYNPKQEDKNNNWIWDVCEQKEKYLKEHDKDKDWIIDYKDNCPTKKNPDQKDTDKDWVWDACDNCSNIYNPDQKDTDKNWIWDICEDVDKDWIVWYQDNCPYIYNPDQKDQNNNWIWNVCEDKDWDWIIFQKDNCPYTYNPNQKDTDKDWIWDVCDKKDNRFIESNKWFFVALMILIAVIFSSGIWWMVNKIKGM